MTGSPHRARMGGRLWRWLREPRLRTLAMLASVIVATTLTTFVWTFLQTESRALALRAIPWSAKGDLVVDLALRQPDRSEGDDVDAASRTVREHELIRQTIEADVDIAGVERIASGTMTISGSRGEAALVRFHRVPRDESMGWVDVAEGVLPVGTREIALPKDLARELGAGIGQSVDVEQGGVVRSQVKIVGYLDAPHRRFISTVLVSDDVVAEQGAPSRWLVRLSKSESRMTVAQRLQARLTPLASEEGVTVTDTRILQRSELSDRLNGGDAGAMTALWTVACAVASALMIGAMYAVVTERRPAGSGRDALPPQRHLLWALTVGALGSIAGIALGLVITAVCSGLATSSLRFGLAIDPLALVCIGVAATIVMVLCAVTSFLRPAASVRRAVIYALFTGAAIALAAYAPRVAGTHFLTVSLAAGAMVAVGSMVLIICVLGILMRRHPTGARSHLARTSLALAAVILSTTVVTALAVSHAVVSRARTLDMDRRYQIDMVVGSASEAALTSRDVETIREIGGVRDAVMIATSQELTTTTRGIVGSVQPVVLGEEAQRLARSPLGLADGHLGVSSEALGTIYPFADGDQIQVGVEGKQPVTLRVVATSLPLGTVITPGTLASLGGTSTPDRILVRLNDPISVSLVSSRVSRQMARQQHPVVVDETATERSWIEQDLTIMREGVTAGQRLTLAVVMTNLFLAVALATRQRYSEGSLRGRRARAWNRCLRITLPGIALGLAAGIAWGLWGGSTTLQILGLRWAGLALSWPHLLAMAGLTLVVTGAAFALGSWGRLAPLTPPDTESPAAERGDAPRAGGDAALP